MVTCHPVFHPYILHSESKTQSLTLPSPQVGADPVRCEGGVYDRYKRLIAICYVGNQDINAEMVRQGWALAYSRYSKDYVDDENAARIARKGLWQGEFVPPWEWRRK